MTTPTQALTNLAAALPKDPADNGPIGVSARDVRALVDAARGRATAERFLAERESHTAPLDGGA